MITKLRIAILAQLTLVLSGEGVKMTLNPQMMVVGSTTEIPVTVLEMRCSSDGTLDIQYLVQIRISRRKLSEASFTGIAFWRFKPGSLNGEYQLDSNLPQDILSRTPSVSASFDPSQKSGLLVVTMNGQGLTCSNQAEFNCSLSYVAVSDAVSADSENKNFTVTATPNDVLMDSAEYYDNTGNTLQLTNNMQLNVGTRIKYRCTANIGSLATGEIIWDRSPELQGSNTPFIPYTPTITTDIVQEPAQIQPDGCSYKRISTMYYNLTSNDYDGITFRCRARSYLGNQWYEAVSNQQFRTAADSHLSWNSSRDSKYTSTESRVSISEVFAILLGALFGVSVILIVILSIFVHRYRKSAEELKCRSQSRPQMYEGLEETSESAAPYAVLNREPPDNHQQSDYLNAYDRLDRTVGHSELYDMQERGNSDQSVPKENKPYVNMEHNVL